MRAERSGVLYRLVRTKKDNSKREKIRGDRSEGNEN